VLSHSDSSRVREPPAAPRPRREPVSIVTVFNDPDVRRTCLDRSIEAHRDEAPRTEYLPIDNVGGAFASAGAALNHGAAKATHEYVVFAHQDVYLHSLVALEEAAGLLADDGSIGLLGAIGVSAEGRFFGCVRDRVLLLGEPAGRPATVDCVDELLFVIPRRLLEHELLAEDPALAWHAYAVEYGLRARSHGLRVCAVAIPLTHNSLTTNLDRLDSAYAAIAAKHPEAMPVVTPQGTVGRPPRLRDRAPRVLEAHRWRYRWLRESIDAHAGRRAIGGGHCLLADIRLDVDELLARLPAEPPLLVISVDRHASFTDGSSDSLALTRSGRPILLAARPLPDVASAATGGPVLVTNIDLEALEALAPSLPSGSRVLGFRSSIGYWLLIGVEAAAMPPSWRSRQATPFGMNQLKG
jgi:Glycosyltransferase like family